MWYNYFGAGFFIFVAAPWLLALLRARTAFPILKSSPVRTATMTGLSCFDISLVFYFFQSLLFLRTSADTHPLEIFV